MSESKNTTHRVATPRPKIISMEPGNYEIRQSRVLKIDPPKMHVHLEQRMDMARQFDVLHHNIRNISRHLEVQCEILKSLNAKVMGMESPQPYYGNLCEYLPSPNSPFPLMDLSDDPNYERSESILESIAFRISTPPPVTTTEQLYTDECIPTASEFSTAIAIDQSLGRRSFGTDCDGQI